jgi:hypothetical protein
MGFRTNDKERGRNVMSEETINYVIHLHKSGNEANAIAEHTGLSFWTVAEILYKFLNFKCTI